MYLRIISIFAFILTLCGGPVFAQFEGEIQFQVFNPDQQSKETVQMDMTFTKNRIFVDSNVSMNVMAGLQAQGVLVRHDREDFVVITSQQEGLQVVKSDLESLINLMNRMQGRETKGVGEPFPWKERLTETGEQKEIHGYNSHHFLLKGDSSSDYVSVWLSDEIIVDWGLLMDAWYAIGAKQIDREIPIEIVMNDQSFPLLIEVYKNDQLTFKAEAVSVEKDLFDRSKTRLSSNLKLIGLSDLMMNMFRQN